MWNCKVCNTLVEDDSWENCWKCSQPRDLPEEDIERLKHFHDEKLIRRPACLRCQTETVYSGTKRFHEGGQPGFWFGDFGHLFEGAEHYDVYYCPMCGKLEFFLDGIGDQMRGEQPEP